jgi:hypothetical protein
MHIGWPPGWMVSIFHAFPIWHGASHHQRSHGCLHVYCHVGCHPESIRKMELVRTCAGQFQLSSFNSTGGADYLFSAGEPSGNPGLAGSDVPEAAPVVVGGPDSRLNAAICLS